MTQAHRRECNNPRIFKRRYKYAFHFKNQEMLHRMEPISVLITQRHLIKIQKRSVNLSPFQFFSDCRR